MSDNLTIWQNAFVKGFKLIPYDTNMYSSVLGYFENKQVEFCIREKNEKPSHETHKYYRGVILPLCLQTELFRGWKLTEVHDYFKSQFLKDVITKEMNGTTVMIVTTMSTAECGKRRMQQFIEDVKNFLSEHGIVIPDAIKQ